MFIVLFFSTPCTYLTSSLCDTLHMSTTNSCVEGLLNHDVSGPLVIPD